MPAVLAVALALSARPNELPAVFCDFESPGDLKRFSVKGATVELVEAHATSGKQAMKLVLRAGQDCALDSSWYNFGWGFPHDWSNAVRFEFDAHATAPLAADALFMSGLPGLGYKRASKTLAIPAGKSTVRFDLAELAQKVEIGRMFGFRPSLRAQAPTALHIDSLRLVFDGRRGSKPRGVRLLWTDQPKTTMTVVWETDLDGESVVEYGAGALSRRARGSTKPLPGRPQFPGYLHVVKLKPLRPGTTYAYRCGDGRLWSDKCSFTTAPADDRAHVTFTVGGDSKDELGELVSMLRVAAAQKPRFHVFLGDMVPRGEFRFQWDRWFDASEELARAIPIMPVTGDHEASGDRDHANYLARYPLEGGADGGRDYVFDYGLVRLISLHYDASRPQTKVFLRQALGARARKWTVVGSHWPFATSTRFGAGGAMTRAFGALMDSANLPLVFGGHAHSYERSKPLKVAPSPPRVESDYSRGTCYIVSGGMGATVTPAKGAAWCEQMANELHVTRVDVSQEALEVSAVAKDGRVIDRFTLRR